MSATTHRYGFLPTVLTAAGLMVASAAFRALRRRGRRRPVNPTPAGTTTAAAEPEHSGTQRRVGILSDSHAYGKNSWWRQTILAGAVPGLRPGPFESYPGAQTAGLVGYLDAAVKGADLVVVQAGTNDLLRGKSPEEAAQGVYTLWDGIRARGASPVAALVPPSDTRPSLAAELNGLLAEAAAINGIPVIDVYSPVAAEDGSWATGLTRDGIHSNKRGSDLMAKAAHGQLPKLAG